MDKKELLRDLNRQLTNASAELETFWNRTMQRSMNHPQWVLEVREELQKECKELSEKIQILIAE